MSVLPPIPKLESLIIGLLGGGYVSLCFALLCLGGWVLKTIRRRELCIIMEEFYVRFDLLHWKGNSALQYQLGKRNVSGEYRRSKRKA
jgi:hypothetical protein